MPGLPVVSFRFSEEYRSQNPDVQQKWVQTLLRAKGWIVPNYELAPDLEDVEILRVVVRESVTADMIDRLVADIVRAFPVVTMQSADADTWCAQIETVQELAKKDSPVHALTALQGHKSTEQTHGKLDKGHGSKSSGTYAKPC